MHRPTASRVIAHRSPRWGNVVGGSEVGPVPTQRVLLGDPGVFVSLPEVGGVFPLYRACVLLDKFGPGVIATREALGRFYKH